MPNPTLQIKPLGALIEAARRFSQQLFQPQKDVISNIDPALWPSPLQPVKPMGPPRGEPTAFQFWYGQNLLWQPRADSEYSASDLKELSRYPLARIAIDNVKDTLIKASWEIQLRPQPGESRKAAAKRGIGDKTLATISRFFEMPDREHVWPDWVRTLLEDMLVIDAASILIRKTRAGEIVELPVMRGEMFVRYIDAHGYTPMPPEPAYAQNWWGLPYCLPDDTEVLTDDGWKFFQDVDLKSDQIATRHPVTKCFEWQQAQARQEFDYDGELIRFDSKCIDVAATPEHRMIIERLPFGLGGGGQRWKGKAGEAIITAAELEKYRTTATGLPVTSRWHGTPVSARRFPSVSEDMYLTRLATDEHWREMSHAGMSGSAIARAEGVSVTAVCRALRLSRKRNPNEARVVEMTGGDYCGLVGIYLAEGSCDGNFINIAQSEHNPRRAEIEKLLARINGCSVPAYSTGAYKFSAKYLARHLRRLGHAADKFIPSEIMNAPPDQLRIFWHYFWLGDGDSHRSRAFTSSKRLAGQLQELAQKIGSYATVREVKARDKTIKEDGISRAILAVNSQPQYIISIRTRTERGYTYRYRISRKQYVGKVRCLTVPNGTLYVRRNGKPCWIGNCNLTTDQLIYKPRNIVPRNTIASQLYGMAPTESLAPEIELGRMRLAFNLAYYKEGSIPGVVQVVPRGTSPDKIVEAMQWMNSDLAGNLAERRQWRMVQGFNEPGKNDQILFPKEPLLSDPFDDNHIRKIAYGYGISPQRLMKMIRTEGKASQEAADIEGLMPYVAWLKSVMDYIIQRKMGYMDYEMVFEPFTEPDPNKQAETLTVYVKAGVLTINEAREKIGEEPSAQPESNQLGIVTGSGFVVLGQQAQPKGAPEGEGNEPPKRKPGVDSQTGDELEPTDAEAKPPKKSKPNGHGAAAEAETKVRAVGFAPGAAQTVPAAPQVGVIFPAASVVVEKKAKPAERKPIKIDPARLAPQSILARQKFIQILDKKFKTMRRKTVKGIAKALSLPHAHLAKAGAAQTTQQILDSLAAEWLAIADSADEYLTDAALAGAGSGALQLEISDEGMLGGINTVAQNWASNRAAELVGMKRVNGELVENPNAKWAISDTTRDKIKEIVTQSFEAEPKTLRQIEDEIDQTGIFSDVRASTIARNEIARAQTQGNMASWKQSGMVETVNIVLSADHDKDDECDDAASGGPYPIDEAPEVPIHPLCLCSVVVETLTGEGEEEEETEKLAKYSEDQERVPAGDPGGGEFAGEGESGRAARAKAAYNPATAEKQRLADKEEKKVAETIGGERTPDNSPFDVTKKGHAVEVKTVVDAKADKVTMRKECMERKVAFAKKNKMASHTVIIDTRGSKIAYYYHEGVGSFRFGASGSAEKVSLTRLKELIR